ncbi:MAG TPA: NAD-dependent epimerase/dehydratase family protein [Kiritimatiellia bacterium]|nr:NAD-dependent epimerase/dehydratase family protein [Kiritimatiellia bacterium]
MSEQIPQKVLVTGGSGFLGINLVRHLFAKGVPQVRSLDLVEFDYPEKDRVEAVVGDIRDAATAARCMEGVQQVVHTAAALPLYSPEDIHTTDVVGTRILLEAARKAGVERFVMISSTAVYGIPDHHPLMEDDEMIGVGPYGRAKIEAEAECLKARGQGLCVPIIRPKSFIGPERLGVFAMLYDWAHTGHGFPMIGNGKNRYQLLDVEDLCEAIWRTMTLDAATVNDIFNIGAKEFTTMGEDYQAVLDDAGHGKKIRGFPAAPMIWTLRFLEMLKLSPLYKWVYETASKDSFVSIDKAERVLGFTPRFSNKDALVRNYRWYVEHLDQFRNASGVSHRVPWKQGILSLAKHLF